MSTNVSTLSPDSGLSPDVSITDLGAILGGGEPAPPAKPAAEPAKEPAKVPEQPEAAVVETPAAEPDKKIEAEEIPADQQQEEQPGEEQQEKQKKEGWVDKRLRELGDKRRQADALAREEQTRREAAERESERLKRELDALKGQPGPKQTAEDGAPNSQPKPADGKPVLKSFIEALKDGEEYETAVERYTDASMAWQRKQDAEAHARDQQTQSAETQKAAFLKDWKVALAKHPDFEDAVAVVRGSAPAGLQEAISQLRDDNDAAIWPDVVMHFHEHPEKLESLSVLYAKNPLTAITRLGVIAAGLEAAPPVVVPPKTPAQPKVTPKTPPKVVGGHQAPAPVDLEKADMNTFAREVTKYL